MNVNRQIPPEAPVKARLVRSTLLVSTMRMLDFGLSFLVSVLIASRFGLSSQIDAFFLARRITIGFADSLKHLVEMVAMPAIVARQDGAAPSRTIPIKIRVFAAVLLVLTILGMLWPGPLIAVFAPGFDGDRRALAEDLVSILMPLLPMAVLASLLATLLQAHKRFFTAEASKMLQRGLLVLVLAFAIPPLGILSAGWTMLAGGAIGLALLSVAAFRTVRADPTSLFRKKPGRCAEEQGGSAGGLVAAIVLQVYFAATTLIDFAVASTLAVGSVSALEYGSRLVSLLPGLVTASVFTVIYPELIRTMRGPDRERASATFGEFQRLAFFVQLPVSIGLMIAAYPIVDVIFGHGAFEQADVAATASATAGFAAAAIFLMPFNITTGVIYADPRRSPLVDIIIIAVAGLLLRAVLVLLAAPHFGAPGIAWAAALSTFGVFVLATLIAARRFPRFALTAQTREFARSGLCGLAAALAGAGLLILFPQDVGALDGLAVIALLGAVTIAVYAAMGAVLHVPEMRQAISLFRARLPAWLRSRL